MLAIDSGGVDISATNFAPVFSRIVKDSLIPEINTFKMEDLDYIDKTRIQISELSTDKIVEIAKNVNQMRLKGSDSTNTVVYRN